MYDQPMQGQSTGALSNQRTGYAHAISYAAPADAPESPSRIRDGIGDAEEALSAVHFAISALEKRLDTVVAPTAPDVRAEPPAAPRAIASPLASRVEKLTSDLQAAVRRLAELTMRVEV